MGILIDHDRSIAALESFSKGDRFYIKKEGNVRYIAVAKGLIDKIVHCYLFGSGAEDSINLIKSAIVDGLFTDLSKIKLEGASDAVIAGVAKRVSEISRLVWNAALPEDEFSQGLNERLHSLLNSLLNKKASDRGDQSERAENMLEQLILTGLISKEMCVAKRAELEPLAAVLGQTTTEIEREIRDATATFERVGAEKKAFTERLFAKICEEKGILLSEKIKQLMTPGETLPQYTANRAQQEKLNDLCQKLCQAQDRGIPLQEKLEDEIVEVMQAIKHKRNICHIGSRAHSRTVCKRALQAVAAESFVTIKERAIALSNEIQKRMNSGNLLTAEEDVSLSLACQTLYSASGEQQEQARQDILSIIQQMAGEKTEEGERIYKDAFEWVSQYKAASILSGILTPEEQAEERMVDLRLMNGQELVQSAKRKLSKHDVALQQLSVLKDKLSGASLFLGVKAKLHSEFELEQFESQQVDLLSLCTNYCSARSDGERQSIREKISSSLKSEQGEPIDIGSCFEGADRLRREDAPSALIQEDYFAG